MENKQTAVEWLVEQITKYHDKEFATYYKAEIDQAEQMEKQQLQESYMEGYDEGVYDRDYK